MRNALARARRAYGAHPLHLLALIACFALTGYVTLRLVGDPSVLRIVVWFLAAVIAHDLVLFPLYALADRSLTGVLRLLPGARRNRTPVVSPLNYLRTPALGAGLLLVLFLPGIIQQGRQTFRTATGLTQAPYLSRWLLITAALFALSAVVYALRSRHASAPVRAALRELRSLFEPGEKLLSHAERADRRIGVLCTTRALYHRSPGWQRIGWADVNGVQWRAATGELVVTGQSGDTLIPLADPADLVRTAQEQREAHDQHSARGGDDETVATPDHGWS